MDTRFDALADKIAAAVDNLAKREENLREIGVKLGKAAADGNTADIDALTAELTSATRAVATAKRVVAREQEHLENAQREVAFKDRLREEYLGDDIPEELADRIYQYAYLEGHSSGVTEIEYHYSEIAPLCLAFFRTGLAMGTETATILTRPQH